MEKKKNTRRLSEKKKARPRIRFSIWGMIIIFALSFAACFALYMLAANFNDNFMQEEFGGIVIENDDETEEPGEQSGGEVQPVTEKVKSEVTNPVPQSEAVDSEEYLSGSCLITDSILLAMGEHSDFKDIIGSSELNVTNCNTAKVESNYGTVTIYETLKIKKPKNVYIMLGSDLGTSENNNMISEYSTLLRNLQSSLPDMEIYVMQYPPVIADKEPLTNELINQYNEQLLSMANRFNVHCIDTSTALKSVDGTLAEEYWDAENNAFSDAAYQKLCGYILTHVAK